MKPVYHNIDAHRKRLLHLLGDGGFHKAKTIPMNSRLIRELCSLYPKHFFSTQQGYKLTARSSTAELYQSIGDLRSRMRHIDVRATCLEGVLRDRQEHANADMFPLRHGR